jgi:PAS domain S-box-containing protein
MTSASVPPEELQSRDRLLGELRAMPRDGALDAVVRLASRLMDCPSAALVLGQGSNAWIVAKHGFPGPGQGTAAKERTDACALSMASGSTSPVARAAQTTSAAAASPCIQAEAAIIVEQVEVGRLQVFHPDRRAAAQVHAPLQELALLASRLLDAKLSEERSRLQAFRVRTQQQAAEQSLALAEERWKFALEGSGQGVWDWDIEHHTAFYSVAWKSIFGHAEGDVGNSADEWLRRIHPEDMQQALQELHRHLRGETPVYEGEYRMRHRDGRDLWVHNRGQVVSRMPDGRARRLVGTVSDVTAHRNAAQGLRDKQAAELASRAKTEFLSRMSHEMRTPLNAVIGFSQLLRSHPGELDRRSVDEYADHVLRAGQHLLALINDVLDLQQVEQGRISLDLGVVPLDETVERTIELLTPLAHDRNVRFVNLLPRGLRVIGDSRRLQQVLLNVASNAVKYNRPGGSVRWSLDATGPLTSMSEPQVPPAAALPARSVALPTTRGHLPPRRAGSVVGADLPRRLRLSIEDNGPGMSPQQTRRLFQPFERLGRETSAIEGTGLGLIIARSLVEEMNGVMTVKSQLAAGTRIVIELPLAADDPNGEPPLLPRAATAAASHEPVRPVVTKTARRSAVNALQLMPDPESDAEVASTRPQPLDEATATAPSPASEEEAPIASSLPPTGSPDPHPGESGDAPAPPSEPAVHRMLYVEDNRINAILFQEAIRLRGQVDLRIAEDGVEALELVQGWLPDVLVLDAHLPGMTGFDVLKQLRAVPGLADVPAFMCSADAMPDDLARARDAGFVGYWTKPIDFARVFADLDRWVD